MSSKKCTKILYDTDFLIALFLFDQSTHHRAKKIFQNIQDKEPCIINLVKHELATVLSRKFSYQTAYNVIQELNSLPINFINLDAKTEELIWKEFFSHQKKNISFIDCANLVIARKEKILIASFDKFYPKNLLAK